MLALQHTATDSLAGPTVFRASTGQTPCVPRSLIALHPFRMACSWLTVTDWLSRLCYYLMGVLVTLVGQLPHRYHIIRLKMQQILGFGGDSFGGCFALMVNHSHINSPAFIPKLIFQIERKDGCYLS
jgi:hypothetical protein